MLVGLWVSTKHPNMNTFLKPFVESANDVSSNGVVWKLNDARVKRVVKPACLVVDSRARNELLNMKRFNGEFVSTPA